MIRRVARPNKYKARKTQADGIVFDSAKEANRYRELRLLEKAGVIRELELQPKFQLMVQPDESDVLDAVIIGCYRGDFRFDECDHANGHSGWITIVEDVKGFKTPLYKWKKKHVEAQYGIVIREV